MLVVEFVGQSVHSRYTRLRLYSRREAFVEKVLLHPARIWSLLFNERLSKGTTYLWWQRRHTYIPVWAYDTHFV